MRRPTWQQSSNRVCYADGDKIGVFQDLKGPVELMSGRLEMLGLLTSYGHRYLDELSHSNI